MNYELANLQTHNFLYIRFHLEAFQNKVVAFEKIFATTRLSQASIENFLHEL
jgi:hypothetical protein